MLPSLSSRTSSSGNQRSLESMKPVVPPGVRVTAVTSLASSNNSLNVSTSALQPQTGQPNTRSLSSSSSAVPAGTTGNTSFSAVGNLAGSTKGACVDHRSTQSTSGDQASSSSSSSVFTTTKSATHVGASNGGNVNLGIRSKPVAVAGEPRCNSTPPSSEHFHSGLKATASNWPKLPSAAMSQPIISKANDVATAGGNLFNAAKASATGQQFETEKSRSSCAYLFDTGRSASPVLDAEQQKLIELTAEINMTNSVTPMSSSTATTQSQSSSTVVFKRDRPARHAESNSTVVVAHAASNAEPGRSGFSNAQGLDPVSEVEDRRLRSSSNTSAKRSKT
ncbi:unnamed protein product, partial [Amoebophrya sp. A25]|eukprot:GSA25T00015712001.1